MIYEYEKIYEYELNVVVRSSKLLFLRISFDVGYVLPLNNSTDLPFLIPVRQLKDSSIGRLCAIDTVCASGLYLYVCVCVCKGALGEMREYGIKFCASMKVIYCCDILTTSYSSVRDFNDLMVLHANNSLILNE